MQRFFSCSEQIHNSLSVATQGFKKLILHINPGGQHNVPTKNTKKKEAGAKLKLGLDFTSNLITIQVSVQIGLNWSLPT